MSPYVFILYVTAHLHLVSCTSAICSSGWKGGIETTDRKKCSRIQSVLLITPAASCCEPAGAASVQDALASAPLVGDLAGIKAREEFSPSSKAEKHAARLHAEAGRLYNEEE